jgi:hypothetical protein
MWVAASTQSKAHHAPACATHTIHDPEKLPYSTAELNCVWLVVEVCYHAVGDLAGELQLGWRAGPGLENEMTGFPELS